MKIYITGLSGTGKTSIVEALLKKGIRAIDIDDDLGHWENKHTNEHTEWHPGKDDEWHRKHTWLCDVESLKKRLAETEHVVVVGSADNQSDYVTLFDKVFVLRCRPEVFLARIQERTTNDFGKLPPEQRRLLTWQRTFETEMVQKGAIPLDAERPLEKVVEDILVHLNSNPH
ncbi:MAG: AAA family ATPase [bacterium]|nr:AAA family ATPase [bacterium]